MSAGVPRVVSRNRVWKEHTHTGGFFVSYIYYLQSPCGRVIFLKSFSTTSMIQSSDARATVNNLKRDCSLRFSGLVYITADAILCIIPQTFVHAPISPQLPAYVHKTASIIPTCVDTRVKMFTNCFKTEAMPALLAAMTWPIWGG